jgi:hypothetical protein
MTTPELAHVSIADMHADKLACSLIRFGTPHYLSFTACKRTRNKQRVHRVKKAPVPADPTTRKCP